MMNVNACIVISLINRPFWRKPWTVFLFLFCCFGCIAHASEQVFFEAIDVVIPCKESEKELLEPCIEGIKVNCNQIRRIIVISDKQLTDKAEWFDTQGYPFTKYDVIFQTFRENEKSAKEVADLKKLKVDWYYKELLKLYAAFVIPDISSNVLVLDVGTVFLNNVRFIDPKSGKGLYNVSEPMTNLFDPHAQKLLPSFKRFPIKYSGQTFHMLFQRWVLEELFREVENIHGVAAWKAFCLSLEPHELFLKVASAYEIYFHFLLTTTDQGVVRKLKWEEVRNASLQLLEKKKAEGLHYLHNTNVHKRP